MRPPRRLVIPTNYVRLPSGYVDRLSVLGHARGVSERFLDPEAPFVAVSRAQADLLTGLNVVATIHHAVDTVTLAFQPAPDDYLLFLGRFTAGKGVLAAIEVARRTG